VLQFVVHEHLSHYSKLKLNSYQHGFLNSKCTVTNLVTYLGYVSDLVTSQCQVDATDFDLSGALELVLYFILLGKT
jgi:hypothetical protein